MYIYGTTPKNTFYMKIMCTYMCHEPNTAALHFGICTFLNYKWHFFQCWLAQFPIGRPNLMIFASPIFQISRFPYFQIFWTNFPDIQISRFPGFQIFFKRSFQISRFFWTNFPDFQNESGNLEIWKVSPKNREIWKSGNLESWKSGNLETSSKKTWKSANLEIWKLNLLCM